MAFSLLIIFSMKLLSYSYFEAFFFIYFKDYRFYKKGRKILVLCLWNGLKNRLFLVMFFIQSHNSMVSNSCHK